MKRTWLLVASALVALFATAALAYGAEVPSPPFDTNAKCLACHAITVPGGASLKVDFAVPGAVNLEKCRACHQSANYLANSHPHFTGACGNCHNGDDAFYFAWPGSRAFPQNTSYGYFLGLTSIDATSGQLHALHSGSGWVESQLSPANPLCSSCHATASCTACHDAPIAHGDHATPRYPGRTLKQANGASAPVAVSTCVDPSCHSLAAAGTPAFTPSCLSCHAANVNDHGGNHSYTAASDYSEATQTGCANSGAGCHGSDSSRTDIRSAYDHIGCTSGPCHTSVSKPSVTAPLECAKCHAGNFVGAPNRMVLTGAYPNGHYNETTHTVPNGIMTTQYVSAGGSATAACIVCHDRALPTAHTSISSVTYGSKLSCAECHNDVATNGLAQVRAGWTTNTCNDCHTVGSAAPIHGAVAPVAPAVSTAGCAGSGISCHTSANLHELHKNASSCQIGCHTKDQGAIVKSCGSADSGCHKSYDSIHYNATAHTATGDIDGSFVLACVNCHSAVLLPAHSNTPASTCSGCHANSGAAPVILAGWNKNCSACHPTKHVNLSSVHQGQPVSGNACLGSGCHVGNSTNLMAVHSGIANSCGLAGCHDAANKDKRPTKKSCGTGGACHDGKLDGNHGGDHSYTAASNYNATTEVGCTNSGTGCHGSDTTYADVRARYNHIGCTGGACHTSASKPSVGAPLECAKCHAGNFVGAPNRLLSGSFPNGHYNETTHTATAMTRAVTSGGTATAACAVCHDAGLKGVHVTITSATYGTNLSCVECHNDSRSSGNAQVLAKWSTDRCDDCHKTGASAPMHSATTAPVVAGSSTAGCTTGTGCHATDLHALHKNAASCALVGCHVTKNVKPTGKTCGTGGTCHTGSTGGHKLAEPYGNCAKSGCHGPGGTTIHNVSSHKNAACLTCHGVGAPGCVSSGCHSASIIHSRPTHQNQSCLTCHTSGAKVVREPFTGCNNCHSTSDIHGRSDHSTQPCTTCHGVSAPGCTKSGCHSVNDIHGQSHHQETICTTCHVSGISKPHQTVTPRLTTDATWATACERCHDEHHSPNDCYKCHSPLSPDNEQSKDVHSESEHTSSNSKCSYCHNISPADAALNCVRCHPGGKATGMAAVAQYGTLAGLVKDVNGVGIQGVTVSIGTVPVITGADGRYVLTNLAPLSVTITVSKTGYVTQTVSAAVVKDLTTTVNFMLLSAPLPASNLARTGAGSASSTYSSWYAATRAFDGSASTYWRSTAGGSQWLQTDLGSAKSVSKVVVKWYDSYSYAKGYRIETSANGTTWVTRYSTTSASSGTKTHTFAAVSARYVRIYCTSANSSNYRIGEFEVWNY